MVASSEDTPAVRPTKRCLDDLGLRFPTYTDSLSDASHPLVQRAQKIPQQEAAGGVERIRSLTDRIWFKCKTSVYRGAVTKLTLAETSSASVPPSAAWWIGAAGTRQQGSEDDFYANLEAEAVRQGKGTGAPSTRHLLPQDIDRRRLEAEIAARAVKALQETVLNLIAASLNDGKPYEIELQGHVISALVRASDASEAYLAIGTEGFIHPEMIALILAAVPGINRDDWLGEPGGVAGITPRPGQIIWSTIIPPEVQEQILQHCDPDE